MSEVEPYCQFGSSTNMDPMAFTAHVLNIAFPAPPAQGAMAQRQRV